MNQSNTKKLAIAGILCAVAVVGSLFTFPVLASKCAPIQHMVNVLCAVLLGPWYGVGVAFGASLIRNLLGLGTIMAFPGSMCGALLCGLVFWKTRNLPATLVGEVFGTGADDVIVLYSCEVIILYLKPNINSFRYNNTVMSHLSASLNFSFAYLRIRT